MNALEEPSTAIHQLLNRREAQNLRSDSLCISRRRLAVDKDTDRRNLSADIVALSSATSAANNRDISLAPVKTTE